MRINKYIAQCGICSRREADRLIKEGKVQINGQTAVPGDPVQNSDTVVVNGKKLIFPSEHTYLAFYKPTGVICTFSEKEKNNLKRYIPQGRHLAYAGRLDVASEGLLLLTDDGDLINDLMTGRYGHEKEYVVEVEEFISDEQLLPMRKGMHLPGIEKDTRPCEVRKTGEREFHIILTQGINRQIRRMCEECGLTVKKLKRIRIENIHLNSLKPGEKRTLSKEEMEVLFRTIGSQKT